MSGVTPIRVLTLADEAYAMPLAVMVRSLIENHEPGRALRVTILDGGLLPASREKLERSWTEGLPSLDVRWEFVAPSFGGAEKLPVWGRVPKLTYARLALSDYFADDGRLVLLDSDTLVMTSLAPLQDAPLGEAVVGATVDPYIPVVSSDDGLAGWQEAGLAAETPYFNAGVMVVDLGRWRSEQVTRRAFECLARQGHRLRQYDQDSLNTVLAKRWHCVDARWQSHPRTRWSLGPAPAADPWIIHFSGRLKPWVYQAGTAADEHFFRYLDRTDWRGFRPPSGLTNWALRLYDSPVRRAVYRVERRVLGWLRSWEQRRAG